MKAKTKLIFVLLIVSFNISFAQWETDVRLTNAPWSSFTNPNWCIAANGNVVHTVWDETRDGNDEIYYKRSADGGVTWGTDIRLTNNIKYSLAPSVAYSGNVVHIIWQDDRNDNSEIYYKRSTDGGINWGTDIRLTNNTSISWYPSLSVFGSNVHILWADERDGNSEIYYKRSTDGGINWGEDTRLTNNNGYSYYPSIAVSGNMVHIVWQEQRDGNFEIYYKRSTDGGINWGADTRLTNDIAFSYAPSIAISGPFLHIVWRDARDGNKEIYYKRSTNNGINWESDTRLTNNNAISESSSIAVSGTNVHIVWKDTRDGDDEIYYKRSTDGGINWETDTRLTNNTALSVFPSIAVSVSMVHIVWYDERDGNREIYYKRNPTGNVGIKNISSEIPSKYSLSQNYPNPFNNTSNFKFEIVNTGNVKIVVYDVQGREVQTLVNERLNAGTYEASFDGSMLNSGVYFYKMVSDGYSETKKMLLIK